MLEEIFFEIGVAVLAALVLGFAATIYEFKKFVMRKRSRKSKKK